MSGAPHRAATTVREVHGDPGVRVTCRGRKNSGAAGSASSEARRHISTDSPSKLHNNLQSVIYRGGYVTLRTAKMTPKEYKEDIQDSTLAGLENVRGKEGTLCDFGCLN